MPGETIILFVVLPVAAYLIGSIPTGFLIGLAKGVDVRRAGSGNVGATNVGRVLGRRWGYLCFLLDVLKGLIPVLAAGWLLHEVGRSGGAAPSAIPAANHQIAWLLVGLGTILGHVFSIFLKFRGGKGVATSLGVTLGFFPYLTYAGLAAFAVWLIVALIWRYVSLASVVAALSFPPLFLAACRIFGWPVLGLAPLLTFGLSMMLLVIIRHRSNIKRLLAGTENKIGGRGRGQ
jgi:glycerol-3-phosphate acyltransferase PlsY